VPRNTSGATHPPHPSALLLTILAVCAPTGIALFKVSARILDWIAHAVCTRRPTHALQLQSKKDKVREKESKSTDSPSACPTIRGQGSMTAGPIAHPCMLLNSPTSLGAPVYSKSWYEDAQREIENSRHISTSPVVTMGGEWCRRCWPALTSA
jgi:hypothetical protein